MTNKTNNKRYDEITALHVAHTPRETISEAMLPGISSTDTQAE